MAIFFVLKNHVHVVCNRVNIEVVRMIPMVGMIVMVGIHYATLPVEMMYDHPVMYTCSLVRQVSYPLTIRE